MSPAPAAAGNGRLVAAYGSEQRSHQRYPLSLDVEYKLMYRGRVERLGSGRTLNISSGGAFVEVHDSLPAGGPIELIVNWPFLLEGVCPLKLVIQGRVVRSDGSKVAIKSKHHEFRTAGARGPKTRPSDLKVRSVFR